MASSDSPWPFFRVEHYYSRQFLQAMRIYGAEFPPDSRLTIARIRALLRAGSYRLIVGERDRQVTSFALVWVSRRPVFVHLDYIAVAQEWKGKGIGTALYRWLLAHLADFHPQAHLLTLEVDDSLVGFYRRSQTQLLRDTPYLFPGPLGPVPMNLMVHDVLGRSTLDRATVRGIIRGLYCGLHGRSPEDVSLHSCLKTLPAQIFLT
ncbi:MAG: GNAT family N-acetyltransferase [Deltaproteobacteria bacterium]|nr:GNAT family N-acetyltransferase [Deltaproteobacteria bacterium]